MLLSAVDGGNCDSISPNDFMAVEHRARVETLSVYNRDILCI
jgi:hypothetical protein